MKAEDLVAVKDPAAGLALELCNNRLSLLLLSFNWSCFDFVNVLDVPSKTGGVEEELGAVDALVLRESIAC